MPDNLKYRVREAIISACLKTSTPDKYFQIIREVIDDLTTEMNHYDHDTDTDGNPKFWKNEDLKNA